ncbi:MAG: hypothetical protein ACI4I3_02270 [Acutalibacteraceae bacterium]
MREQRTGTTGYRANHGGKKAFVVAVSVISALIVLLVAFLCSKNSVFFSLAKKSAEKNEFSKAFQLVEKSGGEKAEMLEKYINLRIEINENYPLLLSEYDSDKLSSWNEAAAELAESSELLGEKISSEAVSLSQTLAAINGAARDYDAMRSDILSLMDIFAEINRLHTKDADGKNASFTVSEERSKISEWERLNNSLSEFAATAPNAEGAYLLNYLIKEVQGEIADLNAAMDSVIADGYAETDLVRFSGEGQKRFPDIYNSSNESVNFADKEKYERYMFKELCTGFVESLGGFYAP